MPVPVRKQVQRRLFAPPCLVVIEVVLGETAHVHDAELRVDGRPSVGRRLATIVKAGPGEAADLPLLRAVEFPPLLGRLAPTHDSIIGVHGIAQRIRGVLAASTDRTRRLRPENRPLGILLVKCGRKLPGVVVEANNVERDGDSLFIVPIHRRGDDARRVELMASLHHVGSNALPLLRHLPLQLPFFVAYGPDDD